MAKRHERTLARRSALQALYQSEILGIDADKVLEDGMLPEEAGLDAYACSLVLGVASHRAEIDRAISRFSQNWAIDRMPVVDRSVLRLAVYEMKYVDDVPVSVSINEAVELAKEFGGEDDSHRFVNGVLGRLAKEDGASAAPGKAGDAQASASGTVADAIAPAKMPDAPASAKIPTVAESAPAAATGAAEALSMTTATDAAASDGCGDAQAE